jgi:hypothetical protein
MRGVQAGRARQKKAGRGGGPQPAKVFLKGRNGTSERYFVRSGRNSLCLWFKTTAMVGDKVGGGSYILRRQWSQDECANAHIPYKINS